MFSRRTKVRVLKQPRGQRKEKPSFTEKGLKFLCLHHMKKRREEEKKEEKDRSQNFQHQPPIAKNKSAWKTLKGKVQKCFGSCFTTNTAVDEEEDVDPNLPPSVKECWSEKKKSSRKSMKLQARAEKKCSQVDPVNDEIELIDLLKSDSSSSESESEVQPDIPLMPEPSETLIKKQHLSIITSVTDRRPHKVEYRVIFLDEHAVLCRRLTYNPVEISLLVDETPKSMIENSIERFGYLTTYPLQEDEDEIKMSQLYWKFVFHKARKNLTPCRSHLSSSPLYRPPLDRSTFCYKFADVVKNKLQALPIERHCTTTPEPELSGNKTLSASDSVVEMFAGNIVNEAVFKSRTSMMSPIFGHSSVATETMRTPSPTIVEYNIPFHRETELEPSSSQDELSISLSPSPINEELVLESLESPEPCPTEAVSVDKPVRMLTPTNVIPVVRAVQPMECHPSAVSIVSPRPASPADVEVPVESIESQSCLIETGPVCSPSDAQEEILLEPVGDLLAVQEEILMVPVGDLPAVQEEILVEPVADLLAVQEETLMEPVADLLAVQEETLIEPVGDLLAVQEETLMEPVADLLAVQEEILVEPFGDHPAVQDGIDVEPVGGSRLATIQEGIAVESVAQDEFYDEPFGGPLAFQEEILVDPFGGRLATIPEDTEVELVLGRPVVREEFDTEPVGGRLNRMRMRCQSPLLDAQAFNNEVFCENATKFIAKRSKPQTPMWPRKPVPGKSARAVLADMINDLWDPEREAKERADRNFWDEIDNFQDADAAEHLRTCTPVPADDHNLTYSELSERIKIWRKKIRFVPTLPRIDEGDENEEEADIFDRIFASLHEQENVNPERYLSMLHDLQQIAADFNAVRQVVFGLVDQICFHEKEVGACVMENNDSGCTNDIKSLAMQEIGSEIAAEP